MLFYNLGIRFYALALWLAAPFNKKAFQMIAGRKGWKKQLTSFAKNPNEKLYWFHCASVGEFEQARPIIEKLRAKEHCQIALTFFSPSGYELRKHYDLANLVMYLPLDLPSYAEFFIQNLKPDIAIFVKYDFWFNMMNQIHRAGIKSAVVSAYIPSGHWLMHFPGSLLTYRLNQFQRLFLQDESTFKNLSEFEINNLEVVGDTRFDRVLENKALGYQNDAISEFKGNSKLIVVGSSWSQDEEIYSSLIECWPNVKWLIAPHEITSKNIQNWQSEFGNKLVRWSQLGDKNVDLSSAKVFLLDTVGLLSKVYSLADVAYVGGGFGVAVHNTLEPAVFGIPVIFGPKNERFLEIQHLKLIESRLEIRNSEELQNALELALFNVEFRDEYKQRVAAYFQSQKGASQKVVDWILE